MTDILTYRRHRFDALHALLTGEGWGVARARSKPRRFRLWPNQAPL